MSGYELQQLLFTITPPSDKQILNYSHWLKYQSFKKWLISHKLISSVKKMTISVDHGINVYLYYINEFTSFLNAEIIVIISLLLGVGNQFLINTSIILYIS